MMEVWGFYPKTGITRRIKDIMNSNQDTDTYLYEDIRAINYVERLSNNDFTKEYYYWMVRVFESIN